MTDTPLARLRAQHEHSDGGEWCSADGEAWPCDTIAALDALEEGIESARRHMYALNKAVADERDKTRSLQARIDAATVLIRNMIAQDDRVHEVWDGLDEGPCPEAAPFRAWLREQAEALAEALRNQGLLQNTFHGTVWHIHDCPASFDFAECHYRCRVAREAFALAGMEPYVSPETRRDTEVYE